MTVTRSLPTYLRSDTAGQLRGLEEDGFAIIPGVLDADEVAECRRRMDDLRPFAWDRWRSADGTDHFKCVFNRAPYWLRFLDRPGLIEVAEAALGRDCHIIGMSACRKPAGCGDFAMHIDHAVALPPSPYAVDEELLVSGRVRLPILIATAHFYLEDSTLGHGPTWVVPGSHKSGRAPRPDEREWRGQAAQPVLLDAGDAMIFRSELWHSASRNESAERRDLLQVHYGRRMIAQRFSPYLDFRFNPEVLAQASPRQLRLLGKHAQAAYD